MCIIRDSFFINDSTCRKNDTIAMKKVVKKHDKINKKYYESHENIKMDVFVLFVFSVTFGILLFTFFEESRF